MPHEFANSSSRSSAQTAESAGVCRSDCVCRGGAPPWGVPTEPSLAWTPPPGWPASPPGWAPSLGWQPDPSWPAVPVGYQWWQLTGRGLRRRRIAIVLVGLSSVVGLLYGIYGIAVLTALTHAMHARHSFHTPISPGGQLLLAAIWFGSFAFLIPASSIGLSELRGPGRSARARAAAFVALLCVGAVAQYVADVQAGTSRYSPFARDAWLHDGRSWYALACLLALVVFTAAARLLKPPGLGHAVSTA
jgi:hypothetical protein